LNGLVYKAIVLALSIVSFRHQTSTASLQSSDSHLDQTASVNNTLTSNCLYLHIPRSTPNNKSSQLSKQLAISQLQPQKTSQVFNYPNNTNTMTVIAEGSPVYSSGRLYQSGRGGAGNYHRLSSTPLVAPPTTLTPSIASSSTSSGRFFGGRGGAGNVHSSSERTVFSFDEELERDRLFHSHHAPVYSVGRGGAGNIVPSDAIATRSHYTNDTSPRLSTSSDGAAAFSLRSGADRVLNRLSKIRSNGSQ
jgi:hypothetical protein